MSGSPRGGAGGTPPSDDDFDFIPQNGKSLQETLQCMELFVPPEEEDDNTSELSYKSCSSNTPNQATKQDTEDDPGFDEELRKLQCERDFIQELQQETPQDNDEIHDDIETGLVDVAPVDTPAKEVNSKIISIYECRKAKDIVFASSIILARINFDVTNPSLINAIVSEFSKQAVPMISEYMDELASSRKGRRPFPFFPEIFTIEQQITKTLKNMEAEYPKSKDWNKHMEKLDFLYIRLFDNVQKHPRLKHPGGVHHLNLK